MEIQFYNATSGTWFREANQGVDTVNNYIWANLTHFSVFGIFGTAPSSGGSGGGGGGCIDQCIEDEIVCRDGSMYVCKDTNSDGCTEWSIEYCEKGYECENGECVEMPCVEDWIC